MSNIDKRIEQLEAELAKLKKQKDVQFPITTTIYLHGCDDSLYTKGLELGLDEEAASDFSRTAYEIALTVDVSRDGQATLREVEGIPLAYPTQI